MDDAELQREQLLFQPREIIDPSERRLMRNRRNVKAIDNPRVIFLQREQMRPRAVDIHRFLFFFRIEIDKTATPREVGESAPLRGYDR